MHEVSRVGDHYVVVAPLEGELADLDVVRERRPVPGRIQQIRQPIPHSNAGLSVVPGSTGDERVDVGAGHDPVVLAARSSWRWRWTVS